MSEPDQEAPIEIEPLARALLNFYDEFAELNDQSAFLCAALASVLVDEGCNNEPVTREIGRAHV